MVVGLATSCIFVRTRLLPRAESLRLRKRALPSRKRPNGKSVIAGDTSRPLKYRQQRHVPPLFGLPPLGQLPTFLYDLIGLIILPPHHIATSGLASHNSIRSCDSRKPPNFPTSTNFTNFTPANARAQDG